LSGLSAGEQVVSNPGVLVGSETLAMPGSSAASGE